MGYLNLPKMTAQKLIPNPFAAIGDEHSKLLKTGDIARRLPNGAIDYIDRNDDQIKIRGMLTSPGAVTAQLSSHPDIGKCAVIAFETRPGDKQLVAYYVTRPEVDKIQLSILRAHITELLPEYMTPSHFIKLTDLPLNANGKLDKKALPKPKNTERDDSVPYLPPRNQFETQLARIWQSTLRVEQIGIDDNFFHTGVNSLLAAEVVMQVKQQLNKTLSLQDLFQAPTIKALSPILQADGRTQSSAFNIETLIHQLPFPEKLKQASLKVSLQHLKKPHHILLTGATGFVGIHLLHQLCLYTKAKIYCLVRAKTESTALHRLREMSRSHHLPIDFGQVKIICGDLSAERLGLNIHTWQQLAQNVDCILHNGAWVNHPYSYEQLSATNTHSVNTLIELVIENDYKPLYFTSTVSAIIETDAAGKLQEKFPDSRGDISKLRTGYAQSKWLAEQLLTKAHQHGLQCSIFRLPCITGDSITGIGDLRNDHNNCLIKTCIQLGLSPNWEDTLNLMPVNLLTQAMAKIVANNTASQVYNLSNEHTVSWTELMKILQTLGYSIEIVPVEQWHHALFSTQQELALKPFLPAYMELEHIQQLPTQRETGGFNMENARAALASFGTAYPKVNKNLWEIYIKYMQMEHFLGLPKSYQKAAVT